MTFLPQEKDGPVNPRPSPSLGDIVAQRLSRRSVLAGLAAAAGTAITSPWPRALAHGSSLTFQEIPQGGGPDHAVAPGYRADVLLRWGDPVLPGAPAFDPRAMSVDGQRMQFGYNADYVAYLPLPRWSTSPEHGLLFVNHEYTNRELMWPGLQAWDATTEAQARIEMAAHGASIVEVRKEAGRWRAVPDGILNRRLTALDTLVHVSGPAAGHARMRTKADPTGRTVVGTLNNCAGGTTPWGTVLTCEENFDLYFAGDPARTSEPDRFRRYGIGEKLLYSWHLNDSRFDIEAEPNEPNRFGWVVEYDPYFPDVPPVKRTALGRFKHEGATTVISADGRLAVYSGDDDEFDYLYRFVSDRPVDPENRLANHDLLDRGTLSVARFNADGTMDWLPLVYGQNGLDRSNGFARQADVLIETRRAADVLGATPMDRPEDVETNPRTGRVYVMLTINRERSEARIDAANPRADNRFGHILELAPPGDGPVRDHSADQYRWDVFILAGDPSEAGHGARYHPDVSKDGWLTNPDNCAFDLRGRLWISTDQDTDQYDRGVSDGIYACDTTGPGRALTRFFYRGPIGAECPGLCFTPDGRTLFCAVQHPAEGSTLAAPATRWPDFAEGMPPRPSVVAITKEDGGEIGS
ncbi:MAG: PhoX family phosphatase [Alphaproteobacteria bacterium]|nr:PhoX family phosphatase [Alphaproteobacteria bacterium]